LAHFLSKLESHVRWKDIHKDGYRKRDDNVDFTLCVLCKARGNGHPMVICDSCPKVYHQACIGFDLGPDTDPDQNQPFECPDCVCVVNSQPLWVV
jgi:hypothetical protein